MSDKIKQNVLEDKKMIDMEIAFLKNFERMTDRNLVSLRNLIKEHLDLTFKKRNQKDLEFLKKLRKILNEYHSEIPEVEIGRQNVLNDVDNELKLDERIKQLSKEDG